MNFRKKIETDYDNDLQNKLNTISTAKATIAGPNINYFQSLLNKKKKQEKSMAKLKEANELNELKNCSFSPKINNNIPTDKRDLRWIKLFKYGTQKLQGKKDKSELDLENEYINKEQKDLTFNPNIKKQQIDQIPEINKFYTQDFLNNYNQRIQNGLIEKIIKESINDRFTDKLETSIKLRSEIDKKDNKHKKSLSDNNNKQKMSRKSKNNKNLENHPEKGDAIPLLIIDVNIKPGVKKKIYVFDGDTAEKLADKFSNEHKLDAETKNKLKILIESHMSKLLMGIKEVNESINSDKSHRDS